MKIVLQSLFFILLSVGLTLSWATPSGAGTETGTESPLTADTDLPEEMETESESQDLLQLVSDQDFSFDVDQSALRVLTDPHELSDNFELTIDIPPLS